MNRYISSSLVLTAALSLTVPASAQESLRAALDGTFAPHAMPTMSGGVEGFNVDLVTLIGERLGRDIELTAAQFSGLIPALQAGTYDFLAAPVTVNEERAANLLFTEGFMDTNFAFVVPDDAPDYADLEAFRGKTISVNRGSAYESYLNEHAGEYGWIVEGYGTNTDAVAAVLAGRADANLAGATVAAWAAKQTPGLSLSYEIDTGLVWALSFRQDSEEMRNLVDRAIECLKIDGSMAELSVTWFGVEPAEGTTIVTPTPGYGVPGFPGYVEDDHEASCEGLAS
ncbi:transporter substrate-binding domain-containing protein [Aliihoeflea aestuarii]|jgi:polar amino acid transport system substrate-binding protein|uniref:transporter substrate-binding domain-containing protein n=1 Tax=Aliihoeflea aestuarii TaxID=453840 RepID=UPI002095CF46|nr:transporter substrate-binding domain-containing protein [Aliihoeflea aestuarii]MCO6392985.1 transporter substrate-binding domain-containing protein [Aliihoeflea aestuarii]